MTEIPEREIEELIAYIKKGFADVPTPKKWANWSSVKDFQRAYGDDFFPSCWETIYSWETEDIKYFIPFAMEFHITHYLESAETDFRAELLMLKFQHPDHKFEPIRKRLREIYDAFNPMESEAFHRFFKFIKKYDMGYFEPETDNAISYWREKGKTRAGEV